MKVGIGIAPTFRGSEGAVQCSGMRYEPPPPRPEKAAKRTSKGLCPTPHQPRPQTKQDSRAVVHPSAHQQRRAWAGGGVLPLLRVSSCSMARNELHR